MVDKKVQRKMTLDGLADLVKANSREIAANSGRLVQVETTLSGKITKLSRQLVKVEAKLTNDIEILARLTKDGFDRVDKRFEGVNGRLGVLDRRLDNIADHGRRIERLERKTGVLV